jgi:hypothetical protein
MIAYLPPVIQFTTLDNFIADLETARAVTVYCHFQEPRTRSQQWQTALRATVATHDDMLHIAAVTFRHTPLYREDGRLAGDQERHQFPEHQALLCHAQGLLAQIGIVTIRRGELALPDYAVYLYARLPDGL